MRAPEPELGASGSCGALASARPRSASSTAASAASIAAAASAALAPYSASMAWRTEVPHGGERVDQLAPMICCRPLSILD